MEARGYLAFGFWSWEIFKRFFFINYLRMFKTTRRVVADAKNRAVIHFYVYIYLFLFFW